jgi:uncharacterized protein (UPF0333 family)
MMQKRGQAAMEFLMTYGWALLVVLIAIGALAFFGVLNPSRFLPNSCTLAPGFACTDFKASASTGSIIIELQNGLGENLNSVTLTIDNENPSCSGSTTFSGPSSMSDGDSTQFTLGCPAGLPAGSAGNKFKADLQIGYTITGGLSHTKVGQLVVGIEA